MIIDAHMHIYSEEIIKKLPIEKFSAQFRFFKRELSPTPVEEIIKEMDNADVDKAVLLPIDAETTWGFKWPNEYIAKVVKGYPDRFIGFASVDPHKGTQAVTELERAVKDLELEGLKLIPYMQEFYPNDKKYYPIYQKAVDLNVPVLCHTGWAWGFPMKHCKPIYLDDVALDFPNLKIIMAHGGWPWIMEEVAVAWAHQNVYIDISGWNPRYLPENLLRYINTVLKDRTLFGTDYPLLSPSLVIPELKKLKLKEDVKRKILGENATKLFKLE